MNKKALIGFVIVVVLVGGYFALRSQKYSESDAMQSPEPTQVMESASPDASVSPSDTGAVANGAVKEFTVTGSNFSFSLKEMKVAKGDKVRITFKNAEGFHDFRIAEFNVATKQLKAGAEETVEFVADKTGTFEYYCSVGQHRAMGMHGNLIVQ